jgi:hypothetical protein
VSFIWYAKSYLKRITRRLLEISGDENPGERRHNTTEEYSMIKKKN